MKVKDKVIVVTGGANGVGRALVHLLLKKGAKVAAVDLDSKKLDTLLAEVQDKGCLSVHKTDISKQAEVEGLVHEVVSYFGRVDGIINNAGIIQPFTPIEELEEQRIQKVMDVNFYGTLHMVRSFLPFLNQQKEGHITNVSSMGGFFPVPGQGIYGASKAAVKLLSEALYAELDETAIGVSVVIPGGIRTNIMGNSSLAVQETKVESAATKILLSPEKAAKHILQSMEKNQFRRIIGYDAKLMYFLYHLQPKLAIRFMKKMLTMQ